MKHQATQGQAIPCKVNSCPRYGAKARDIHIGKMGVISVPVCDDCWSKIEQGIAAGEKLDVTMSTKGEPS